MKGTSGYPTHATRLPCAKGPFRALKLHNMSANCPQKAPKNPRICAHWPPTAPNQKQTISWLKTRFRAHLIHPQPPTFGGFQPSKLPYPTPKPPYLGPLDRCKLQQVAQRGGCQNGSTRFTGCKKMPFSKMILDRMECQKKVFLARFEHVVARFGPPKIPKCLENGPFWDQMWVKKWVKNVFFQK